MSLCLGTESFFSTAPWLPRESRTRLWMPSPASTTSVSVDGADDAVISLCLGRVVVFPTASGIPCASRTRLWAPSPATTGSVSVNRARVDAGSSDGRLAEAPPPACTRAPRVPRVLSGEAGNAGEPSVIRELRGLRSNEVVGADPARSGGAWRPAAASRAWSARSTAAGDSAQ